MRMRPRGLAGEARSSASASSAGSSRASAKERDEAERLPTGRVRDRRHAGCKQRRIAAELVDQEAAHQRGVVRIDHRLGADQARDHAAAVDVADEDDRHARRARKSHVGDIVGAQVHFRSAAGAFDQHDIGLGLEPGEAVEHERHQLRLHLLVGSRLGGAVDAALHHDLGARSRSAA